MKNGTLIWTYDQFQKTTLPEPYDTFTHASLCELPTPDNQSCVLLAFGTFGDQIAPSSFYGIEAPKNCPMRKAFEWGEMTWVEYWSHKPWLYEIFCPWNPGPLSVKQIAFEDVNSKFSDELVSLGSNYPYEIKRAALERRCSYPRDAEFGFPNAEREYQEFMMKYGHRFSKIAA